jgi:hypothetical protein
MTRIGKQRLKISFGIDKDICCLVIYEEMRDKNDEFRK